MPSIWRERSFEYLRARYGLREVGGGEKGIETGLRQIEIE